MVLKIEEGLEFPVQQPEDEEFELTGQAGVIKRAEAVRPEQHIH